MGGQAVVVQQEVWLVRKEGEDALGEGSNDVLGCGWGVASSKSRGCWPVVGHWCHVECTGQEGEALS